MQSRLPVDLEIANIHSIEEANQFLSVWIRKFNRQFGHKIAESVYETSPTTAEINLLLATVSHRIVDNGHHIKY